MKADTRAPGPVPRPLGALIEPVYRAAVAARNRAFDRGRRVHRLPVPVVSVGNLSVGGTGKTPMVMRCLRWLIDGGRRPAVAMRGYGAPQGEPSDEEQEIRDAFPGVPVVARPDRLAGLRPLLESPGLGCVVLDDGFQHRFIARDADIVLISAAHDPFADRCLPAGWLREPVESLVRATHIVITHASSVPDEALAALRQRLERLTGRAPAAECRHRWSALLAPDGQSPPIDSIRGRRAVVACGIGDPRAFLLAAEDAGASIRARFVMPDHHRWRPADLRALAKAALTERADFILTTGKDWVKLARLDLSILPCPVLRPRLELGFLRGEEALRAAVLDAASGAAAR